MYSKSVNPSLNSVLGVAKILTAYALVVAGVFFYHHVKTCIVYYCVLFLLLAVWTQFSGIGKKNSA